VRVTGELADLEASSSEPIDWRLEVRVPLLEFEFDFREISDLWGVSTSESLESPLVLRRFSFTMAILCFDSYFGDKGFNCGRCSLCG